MKAVTVNELSDILMRQIGATFVTIVAKTTPDYVGGKKCPVADVHKIAVVNGVINWSYANAVNNQRLREETPTDANGAVEFFTPEARKWGVRLHDEVNRRLLPLVEHKGKRYLELKVQRSIGHRFYDSTGKQVANETVYPHIRKKTEGRRQEVENPVILRDYALENIKAIRVNRELYVVNA
jgi:hypothetical protein